jgi:predicted nuclease with TOPRIM domain
MIESMMYIGIGFLVAGLLVIGVIPLVHARAVRLTMRRLEADNPLSMAEIAAEKDQLRAEFAMTMSRLEMTVEQLKAKTTNQLTELGKKGEAIGRIKFELSEKTATLLALEAKERQLSEDLADTQSELAAKTAALETAERALATAQSDLAQVTASFNDTSVAAGGQRAEFMALRAQTEAMKGQIESYEKETKALWDHLNHKTAELEASSRQLAEERARAGNLANEVGELDPEAVNTQRMEAELHAQLAQAEGRHRVAIETLRTEKSLIENELKRSQDERDKLQREIAAVKRDAENAGAYERMESAVLRERIDEVAAEVVRLTAALEGPGSPIEALLNAERPATGSGNGPSIASRAGESKGTLADRIRALQARAARASPPQREAKRGAPRGARADK